MRCMSFWETQAQMRARTKTVTRRMGWRFLMPGDEVLAVEKYRGVRKDGRVELGTILILGASREMLCTITSQEVAREGFPNRSPEWFVAMFTKMNGCGAKDYVSRFWFTPIIQGFPVLTGSP